MSLYRVQRPGRLQMALDRERGVRREEVIQLCGFRVGEEEYALDIMRIKEIINPLPITRVPKAPSFIEGVVELRGTILPVVDMRKRFDLPPYTPEELQNPAVRRARKYLIVPILPEPGGPGGGGAAAGPTEGGGKGGRLIGLIVDRVSDVIRVSREAIRPAPELTLDEAARYFMGVCHHRERILMVLDIDAILSSSEKISLARLRPKAAPASGNAT
jgi:purine-binding chemotaxis protein CheW